MTMRSALMAAATLLALSASGAFAADMPDAAPPPVAEVDTCNGGFYPDVDRVWRPGQVAYIVAQSCGAGTTWLSHIGTPRRENMLVYYNGGSMNRTDITSINVPIQYRYARPH